MIGTLLYDVPVYAVATVFLTVGLAFAFACRAVVRRVTTATVRQGHAELVSFTATNIAVLYGVLLAFLAVAAWEGFGKASETASQEAALVENLYRDSQGMAAPLAADLRTHILAYLQTIIEVEWPQQQAGHAPGGTERSLVDLHRHIARLSPADSGDTVLMGDMLRVLNQLDNARASRLESQGGRIPSLIWVMIVALGLLTIGFSTFLHADDAGIHVAMLTGLVFAIVLVLVMIVELDSPFRGGISVDVAPYQNVLDQIRQPEPADDAD